MKRLVLATMLASASLIGCETSDSTDIDQQLLAEYRQALPSMSQLEAPTVRGSTSTAQGDPALVPTNSYPLVEAINGGVAELIGTLEAVVALPPTVFNSDTQEFFWGPIPNEDGVGFVGVYIRDVGASEDFRYEYAFLRGIDNDVAKLTPVVWGGATPLADPDHGIGVALFDFEANHAFEQEHNANAGDLELERGRFAVVFGAGPDEENPNAELGFVIAAFRDFVPADEPGATPTDLDYLYGRFADDTNSIDFINWKAPVDIDDPIDGNAELLDVRMAFLNEGIGRAEAIATGGSLGDDETVTITECWDTSINQTHLAINGADVAGVQADCGVLFNANLSDLSVPTLSDLDAGLVAELDAVATNGIPNE